MSGFVPIANLVAAGAWQQTDKTCRQCGHGFGGNHWTRPPIPRYQKYYVLDGRVLGWCDHCINGNEQRLKQQAAPMKPPAEIVRPVRPDDRGDAYEAPWA